MDVKHNTYDENADQYEKMIAAREERYRDDLFSSPFWNLVGNIAGLTVLDAGCGEGYACRELLRRGAGRIVGVDVSSRLLEIAKSKTPEVDFVVHDLSLSLPQYERYFDLVVSEMVIMDVPDYAGFISTIGRVTKVGGRAMFSLHNPYACIQNSRADSYFDSGEVRMYPGLSEKYGVKVYHFHRTMEEYITAFRESRFLLRSFIDTRSTDPLPNTMALEFVKVE